MEKYVWNFEEMTDGFKIEVFDTETKQRYVGTTTDINIELNDGQIENVKKHAEENELELNEEDMKKKNKMQRIKEKLCFNFIKKLIEKKKYTIISTDENIICKFNSANIRNDTFVNDDSDPTICNNVLIISLKRVSE